jgi:catechol 2,3-dioxygenase
MTNFDRRTFLGAAAAGIAVAKAGPTHAETATMTETHAVDMPAFVDHAHLTVIDLPMQSAFYQKAMGLTVLDTSASGETLGVAGRPLLTLTTGSNAARAPRNARGPVPHRFPDAEPARSSARWLAHAAHNNVSSFRARPTIWSAKPSISPTRKATASRSTATVRPTNGPIVPDGTVEMATNRPQSAGALRRVRRRRRSTGAAERHRHRPYPSAGRRYPGGG